MAERQNWKPGNMLYPVPAVMLSVQRPGEKPNIITVAWAGTVCSDPPMVSVSVRPERYSHAILEETKEFALNLVSAELTRAADYCGVRSGRDVDKFSEMKLTPVEVEGISAPGIGESPVILSCRVTEMKSLGSHTLFLAEVVSVSVDGDLLDQNDRLHLDQAGLIAYSHGEYYLLGKKVGKFGYSVRKNASPARKKNGKNGVRPKPRQKKKDR